MSPAIDVVIVGGGLSSLACAKTLHEKGFSFRICESSDRIGGQTQTDHIDGFLLDRGFQVFLTAYPEAQRVLNYQALDLKPFFSGALVRFNRRLHIVADPLSHPWRGLVSILNPIGTIKDKWLVMKLRRQAESSDYSDCCLASSKTLENVLSEIGFSERITTRFFRPFFGGVFSDTMLQTPKTIFEFVFSMFGKGQTTIPANGMAAIPNQLASNFPPESVRTHAKVYSVTRNGVALESGETLKSRAVVIATDQQAAGRLTNKNVQSQIHNTYCLYFSAKEPPVTGPYLILNGDGTGPVNHLAVISQVAPTYAPSGFSLISATVLQHKGFLKDLEQLVRVQLIEWFGIKVKDWEHIRTYSIKRSLPSVTPAMNPLPDMYHPHSNLFICGDYFHSPTHHGALLSGRKTAESVIAHLS